MTASRKTDWFVPSVIASGGCYVAWIAALVAVEFALARPETIIAALARPEILTSLRLSLVSSTLAALAAIWVAVPLGYGLSRWNFTGRRIVELILDVPLVLPPLVVGLSLLLAFQTPPGRWFEQHVMQVSLSAPGVVLAQFTVVTALAVRTMQATFDRIDPRREQVARTLGCSRGQAFWEVTWPAARRGAVIAGTVSWARAFGEFGPVLVFCGTTAFRTEVLPTSIYLSLNSGDMNAAIAISLIMIFTSILVLGLARWMGAEHL